MGKRRGMVRELEQALNGGVAKVMAFIERHSMPEPNTGCWLWMGPVQESGYGYIVDPRRPIHRASMPRTQVHRIVCEIVHRPMSAEEQTRHLCHNKSCVNPDHLAPGTRTENSMDSVRAGHWTFTRGEKNGRAKITAEQAAEIRRDYMPGRQPRGVRMAEEIGARYGISESMVRKIARGENWASGATA